MEISQSICGPGSRDDFSLGNRYNALSSRTICWSRDSGCDFVQGRYRHAQSWCLVGVVETSIRRFRLIPRETSDSKIKLQLHFLSVHLNFRIRAQILIRNCSFRFKISSTTFPLLLLTPSLVNFGHCHLLFLHLSIDPFSNQSFDHQSASPTNELLI